MGSAGVAISTDGRQIASNENAIMMCFQQGPGFTLCFSHVGAISHSIFHKCFHRFRQNLFICKRTSFSIYFFVHWLKELIVWLIINRNLNKNYIFLTKKHVFLSSI